MDKFLDDLEWWKGYKEQLLAENAEIGCTCMPILVNAGTENSRIDYDDYWCPLHCSHRGINTDGEWWCGCGAAWDDEAE